MKLKSLALFLSMALLQVSQVTAANQVKPARSSAVSKSVSLEFLSAKQLYESTTEGFVITNTDSTTPIYVPLSFTQFFHKNGDAIKSKNDGSAFRLEEGTYEITFTGTFIATTPTPISDASPLAANLVSGLMFDDGVIIFPMTQTIPTNAFPLPVGPFFVSHNYTATIKVGDEQAKQNLSFVVADTTPGSSLVSTNRQITITKIK